jgi:hypothetical protein
MGIAIRPIIALCVSYLLVNVQLPEDLGRVEQVVLLEDPIPSQYSCSQTAQLGLCTYFLPFQANRGRFRISATQYPLIRKRKVRKPWTAASGTM